MWEDQGKKIIDTILKSSEKQVDLKQGVDELNQSAAALDSDPAVKLNQAFADMGTAMTPLLLLIADLVGGFADWISNNPVLASTLTAVGIALGIIVGICMALAPIFIILATGTAAFAGAMALLTSPITLAVAAIVAIIAILVLFGDEIMRVYNEFLKPTVDKIMEIIDQHMRPVFEEGFAIMSQIVEEAFVIMQRAWDEVLSPAFNFIISVIEDNLLPKFDFVFGAIASVVSDAFEGIKHVWNNVLKPILNGIIDFISGVFEGNWKKAWKGIVSIFEGIWEGLKTTAKAPLNGIISMVNSLIKGINKMEIPDWVPVIGGGSANIPTIPMLATGGKPVGNGSFIAGEAGPELFTMQGGRVTVTPLSPKEKSLGITGSIANLVSQMADIGNMVRGAYQSMANSSREMRSNNNVTSQQSNPTASGTTKVEQNYNMNFYSPKAIDPYEAARMSRNALREAALQI